MNMPWQRGTTLILLTGLFLTNFLTGCEIGTGHEKNVQDANTRWKAMRASLLLPMAQQRFDSGDLDQAEKTLLDAISVDSDNPSLFVLAGRVALERGQLERSYQRLQTAIELDPKLPEAHYFQGIVLQRWKRYDGAFERYCEAYDLESDNSAFLLAIGEMLVALDRIDEAVELLSEKAEYFDQSPGIRVALGQLYSIEGQYSKAADYYKQASLLDPDDLQIVEELARAQLRSEQLALAVLNLERLCGNPALDDRSDLQRLLARAYLLSGRAGDARRVFMRLTRKDPRDEEAWIGMGEVSWSTSDTSGALLAANRVMALSSDRHEGYLLAGMVWHRRGHLERALSMFDRAAERAPKSAVPMILRGITLEQAGRTDEAALAYTEALRRKPSDVHAQELLAHVAPASVD